MELKNPDLSSSKLPFRYAEVYLLYFQDKLTQEQISEKLSISLYKVRGRLSKAEYLLRKLNNDPEILKASKMLSNTKFR